MVHYPQNQCGRCMNAPSVRSPPLPVFAVCLLCLHRERSGEGEYFLCSRHSWLMHLFIQTHIKIKVSFTHKKIHSLMGFDKCIPCDNHHAIEYNLVILPFNPHERYWYYWLTFIAAETRLEKSLTATIAVVNTAGQALF